MVLYGKGKKRWMDEDFEDDRKDALEDRDQFTDERLEELDVEHPEGGGETDNDFFQWETQTERRGAPSEVDYRKVYENLGLN